MANLIGIIMILMIFKIAQVLDINIKTLKQNGIYYLFTKDVGLQVINITMVMALEMNFNIG